MRRIENVLHEYSDDCHVCGAAVEEDIATCEDCLDVIPNKRFVLECEWCDETWYSNFKSYNVLRSVLHVRRQHREELRRAYS